MLSSHSEFIRPCCSLLFSLLLTVILGKNESAAKLKNCRFEYVEDEKLKIVIVV